MGHIATGFLQARLGGKSIGAGLEGGVLPGVRSNGCVQSGPAGSKPSRSSSEAVSCSTMVPFSISNLPEQAKQTPDVPEACGSSVPSRGGLPEPRHRPT